MPPKKEMDENAIFLYTCLKNYDGTKINFHAVGATLNVKQNTAYKRYANLAKIFESADEAEEEDDDGEKPKKAAAKATSKEGSDVGSKKRKTDGKAAGRNNKKAKTSDDATKKVAGKGIKLEEGEEDGEEDAV